MDTPEISDNMTEGDRMRFLESLLSHYEALVQDMGTELVECKENLRKLSVTEVESRESHADCAKCSVQDLRLENLAKQLEVTTKAKEIQHSLWKSCMEQLENCEAQKLSFHTLLKDVEKKNQSSANRMKIPTIEDLFTKWKLLQVYATGLENRIEKTVMENKMYRRRLLETKLENEVQIKKQVAEKAREIENTKATFSKEIEYLKNCIEKSRKTFHEAIEVRITEEHENWKSQEELRMQELEQEIQGINADREELLIRDTQISIQLREIAKELLVTRNHLQSAQQEKWQLEMILNTMQFKMQSQTQQQSIANIPLKNSPVLLTTEVQTEEIQEAKQLKESRNQMQSLQEEYSKLLSSKEKSEKDSEERISRVLERLSELEQINVKLEISIVQQEKERNTLKSELIDLKKKQSTKNAIPNIQECIDGHGDDGRNKVPNFDVAKSILDVQRIEEKRRQVRELTFTDHIRLLESERNKLMNMLDQQKSISNKWEIEYKTLLQSLEA